MNKWVDTLSLSTSSNKILGEMDVQFTEAVNMEENASDGPGVPYMDRKIFIVYCGDETQSIKVGHVLRES